MHYQLDQPLPTYQILEFYAGEARIARVAQKVGYTSGAHDVSYDQSAMDLTCSAGYMLLALG